MMPEFAPDQIKFDEPMGGSMPTAGGNVIPKDQMVFDKPAPQAYGREDLYRLVVDKANQYGVRPDVALALTGQESEFNPRAKSPTGVRGLMQVTLNTGKIYKPDFSEADRGNPEISADVGMRHLAALYQQYGSWPKAVMAYNGGSDPNYEQNVGRRLLWARNQLKNLGPKQGNIIPRDQIVFDDQTGPPGAPPPAGVQQIPPGTVIQGQITPGNIDLKNRPVVKNPDGTVSTVRSMSFNDKGKEVLIPTVSDDGRILTDKEAVENYRKTGKHLGVFETPADATAYAQRLHQDQGRMYGGGESQPGIAQWAKDAVQPVIDKLTAPPYQPRVPKEKIETFPSAGGYRKIAENMPQKPEVFVPSLKVNVPISEDKETIEKSGKLFERTVKRSMTFRKTPPMVFPGPFVPPESQVVAELPVKDTKSTMGIAPPGEAEKPYVKGLGEFWKGFAHSGTMTAYQAGEPEKGTENYRMAGNLLGWAIPFTPALKTAQWGVKGLFPLVAETLGGRIATAGAAFGLVGGGGEAIGQAARGEPATSENALKIMGVGSQDALLGMFLHYGGEFAGAKLGQFVKDLAYYSKGAKESAPFRAVWNDLIDAYQGANPGKDVPSDKELQKWFGGLSEGEQKYTVMRSPTLSNLAKNNPEKVEQWLRYQRDITQMPTEAERLPAAEVKAEVPEPPPVQPAVPGGVAPEVTPEPPPKAAEASPVEMKPEPSITPAVPEAAPEKSVGAVEPPLKNLSDEALGFKPTWDNLQKKAQFKSTDGKELIFLHKSTKKPGYMQATVFDNGGPIRDIQIPPDVEDIRGYIEKIDRDFIPMDYQKIVVTGGLGKPSANYGGFGWKPVTETLTKVWYGPKEHADWMKTRLESGGYNVELKDITPQERIKSPTPPPAPEAKPREGKGKEPWEMTKEDWLATKPRVTRNFQKYTAEQRANIASSHRMGHVRKISHGEYFYTNDVDNIAYESAQAAKEGTHRIAIQQALASGKPVPAEVLKDYPDLKPKESALPPGVKEFQAKFGTARGVGKPEGLVSPPAVRKGKGANFQKAIERNDLAALLHNLGGVSPESVRDYISTPEERQILGRSILKKGGIPVDVMISEAKAHFPEQFGHFEDPGDMVSYFLDGRHARALKLGSLEKQIEEHYADIEDEAYRKGISPEGLAELEDDVAREIAAEREAIQSEGSAGPESWETELDELYPDKPKFFLTPSVPKTPKLTKRLDDLKAEYPDLNRDRAAAVIRALPEAEPHQVAAMSEDPGLFNQVARGNLKASERAQLLKKATDAGAQMGLPGLIPPGRLFSLAPTFYSQMAVSLEAKLPGKGNGPGLADLIEGWAAKGQFKADELKFSGIIPWLREQTGPVTKRQVMDKLKEGEVRVEVEEKGGTAQPLKWKYEGNNRVSDKGYRIEEQPDGWYLLKYPEGWSERFRLRVDAENKADEYHNKSQTSVPKFQSYLTDLPESFTNRREMLLTVPDSWLSEYQKAEDNYSKLRDDFEKSWLDARKSLKDVGATDTESFNILKQMGSSNEDVSRVNLRKAKDFLPNYDWQGYLKLFSESEKALKISTNLDVAMRENQYKVPGAHAYGDPAADVNRFAHVFLADYVDPKTGKKSLVVTETQSDWAREGRSKGYIQTVDDMIKAGYTAKMDPLTSVWEIFSPQGEFVKTAGNAYKLPTERAALEFLMKARGGVGVPPLPFAKNWHEVALKQTIRYAAENGYDGVMVVNGDMVKQRYDLSKHIDKLYYEKTQDGYQIQGLKNGVNQFTSKKITESELSQNVGKEVAEKIINGKGDEHKGTNWKSLSGVDLQVGGEWANNLYDKTIPSYLRKYVKQWGVEVGGKDVEIPGKNVAYDIWERADKRFEIDKFFKGQMAENIGIFDTRAEAQAKIKELSQDTLTHFPVTPNMAGSVLTKGQPLYKLPEGGQPHVPGREGAADTFSEPQNRSERLARDDARLRGELESFRSRRSKEFDEGRLPQADANLWQEIKHNPALLESSEFQAITAAAKVVGIDEVLPIKSTKINGCIYPERDGRKLMLLSNTILRKNTLTQVAGHETFHFRLARKDWPAIKLWRMVDYNSLTFKRYKEILDYKYDKLGLERLTPAGIAEEIAANAAGGIMTMPEMGLDFAKAFKGTSADLRTALENYRTFSRAHRQFADGDLISKFFIEAPPNKASPPITPKEKEDYGTVLSAGINPEQFKIAKRGLDHAMEFAFNKLNTWGIRPPGQVGRKLMDRYVPTEWQRHGIVNWLRFAYFPEQVARTRPAFAPMRAGDIAAGDKQAELRDEIWGRMQPYFKELNPQGRKRVDRLLLRLDKIQNLESRKRLDEKVAEKGPDYFKGFKGYPINDVEAKAIHGIWDSMRFIRQDLTASLIEHLSEYGVSRGLTAEKARKFAGEIALNLDKSVEQLITEYLPEVKAGTKTAAGKSVYEPVIIGGQKYWKTEEQAKSLADKLGLKYNHVEKQAKGYVLMGEPAEGGAKAERAVSSIEKSLQKQRDTIQFWLRDRAFYFLPHTRWGPFWVRVFDQEGKMVWAGARETTGAAKQMLEDVKKEFGPDHKYKIAREDKKPMELYNNVNMPAVSAIVELAKDKLPEDNRRELMEAWQSFWAAKGWGAHLTHRQNIPGFESENLHRVFADYIEGYVGMRSKMVRANAFTKSWEGFTDREGGNDPALQRYALEYTRYLLDHPYEYAWVRRVLYHMYLGASMGFRLLHGLHAVQTAWPVLSTVTRGAGKILSKAYKDRYALTLEKLGVTDKTSLITDMERQALEAGRRTEALSQTFQVEIAARGASPFSRWMYDDPTGMRSKALDVWKNIYYPGESDRWLREGMFLASLRAVDPEFSNRNALNQEAVNMALELTQAAFFRYARGDRPPIGRGLGAIWFTFQTWVTKYFQLIHKMSTGTLLSGPEQLQLEGPKQLWMEKAKPPDEHWEYRGKYQPGKTNYGGIGRMLIASLAIGGLTGGSFWSYPWIKRLYRKYWGRDASADVKDYMETMFGERYGTKVSQTLLYGLPAGLFGFDLSQRMVHHLPMAEEGTEQDTWGKKLIGAVGGPFEKLGWASGALEQGKPERALEQMLPNFIANPIKAYRLYNEGATTVSGRPIMGGDLEQQRLTRYEAFLKGAGVQPVKMTEEMEKSKFNKLMDQDLDTKRKYFTSRAALALKGQQLAEDAGNDKAAAKYSKQYDAVIDELQSYNDKMISAGRYGDVISNKSFSDSVKARFKPVYQSPKGAKKQMQRQLGTNP